MKIFLPFLVFVIIIPGLFSLKCGQIKSYPRIILKMSDPIASGIPKPNIIVPSEGTKGAIEKFLMMYTCKKCNGKNAQMVSKVAYNYGMVISTCKHCKVKHLIADNKGKLDMPEYGRKIEDYLTSKGEVVQKLSIKAEDLDDNYLIESDGKISLFPKAGGQPSLDVNIIDLKPPKRPGKGFGN